jgi:hypothetical protein
MFIKENVEKPDRLIKLNHCQLPNIYITNLLRRDYMGLACSMHGRIILECILGKQGVQRCGLDSSGSGKGSVAGSCEHGNKSLGSIIGGEYLN